MSHGTSRRIEAALSKPLRWNRLMSKNAKSAAGHNLDNEEQQGVVPTCFTVFVALEKAPPPCLAGLTPSTGLGLPGGRVLLAPRVGFPAVPAPPPPRACATTEIRWSTAAERRRRLGTTAGTRGVEPGADT